MLLNVVLLSIDFLDIFRAKELGFVENLVDDDDKGNDNSDDDVAEQYNFPMWDDESDSLFDCCRDKIILVTVRSEE